MCAYMYKIKWKKKNNCSLFILTLYSSGKLSGTFDNPWTYSCPIIPNILLSKSVIMILIDLFPVLALAFLNFCIFSDTFDLWSRHVYKNIKIFSRQSWTIVFNKLMCSVFELNHVLYGFEYNILNISFYFIKLRR